jgi:hypothetical protein
MKIKIFSLLLFFVTFATALTFVATIQMFSTRSENSKTPTLQFSPTRGVSIPESSPAKLELSCFDPTILPIWSELKRDNVFRNEMEGRSGEHNCSDLLRMELVDLDGDSEDEFLVWGKSLVLCGATANCHMWVFGERHGHMTKLLHSAGIAFEMKKTKQSGLADIMLRMNGGNYPDDLKHYQFDGREYQLARCYFQDKETNQKWEGTCGFGDLARQDAQRSLEKTLALFTGCWSFGNGAGLRIEKNLHVSGFISRRIRFVIESFDDKSLVIRLIDRPLFYYLHEFVVLEYDVTRNEAPLKVTGFQTREDAVKRTNDGISAWAREDCDKFPAMRSK